MNMVDVITTRFVLSGHNQMMNGLRQVGETYAQMGSKTQAAQLGVANAVGNFGQLTELATIAGVGFAVKYGASVMESENLSARVFGKMGKDVLDFSQKLGKASSMNEYEVRRQMGVFMSLATSLQIPRASALEMSKTLTQLGIDMSSYWNKSENETMNALASGIVGNTRALRQYGISLDELSLKQFAYTHGIAAQGTELTRAQKTLASYGLILKQTGPVQGDFLKSLNASPINQYRMMMAQMREELAKFGIAMQGIVYNVLQFGTDIMPIFDGLLKMFKILPTSIQATVIEMGLLSGVIGKVAGAVATVQIMEGTFNPLAFLGKTAIALGGTALVSTAVNYVADKYFSSQRSAKDAKNGALGASPGTDSDFMSIANGPTAVKSYNETPMPKYDASGYDPNNPKGRQRRRRRDIPDDENYMSQKQLDRYFSDNGDQGSPNNTPIGTFSPGEFSKNYDNPNPQFRASGGSIRKGKPYVVGEKGPEYFIPQSDGYIVPNHQLNRFNKIYDGKPVSRTDLATPQLSGLSGRVDGFYATGSLEIERELRRVEAAHRMGELTDRALDDFRLHSMNGGNYGKSLRDQAYPSPTNNIEPTYRDRARNPKSTGVRDVDTSESPSDSIRNTNKVTILEDNTPWLDNSKTGKFIVRDWENTKGEVRAIGDFGKRAFSFAVNPWGGVLEHFKNKGNLKGNENLEDLLSGKKKVGRLTPNESIELETLDNEPNRNSKQEKRFDELNKKRGLSQISDYGEEIKNHKTLIKKLSHEEEAARELVHRFPGDESYESRLKSLIKQRINSETNVDVKSLAAQKLAEKLGIPLEAGKSQPKPPGWMDKLFPKEEPGNTNKKVEEAILRRQRGYKDLAGKEGLAAEAQARYERYNEALEGFRAEVNNIDSALTYPNSNFDRENLSSKGKQYYDESIKIRSEKFIDPESRKKYVDLMKKRRNYLQQESEQIHNNSDFNLGDAVNKKGIVNFNKSPQAAYAQYDNQKLLKEYESLDKQRKHMIKLSENPELKAGISNELKRNRQEASRVRQKIDANNAIIEKDRLNKLRSDNFSNNSLFPENGNSVERDPILQDIDKQINEIYDKEKNFQIVAQDLKNNDLSNNLSKDLQNRLNYAKNFADAASNPYITEAERRAMTVRLAQDNFSEASDKRDSVLKQIDLIDNSVKSGETIDSGKLGSEAKNYYDNLKNNLSSELPDIQSQLSALEERRKVVDSNDYIGEHGPENSSEAQRLISNEEKILKSREATILQNIEETQRLQREKIIGEQNRNVAKEKAKWNESQYELRDYTLREATKESRLQAFGDKINPFKKFFEDENSSFLGDNKLTNAIKNSNLFSSTSEKMGYGINGPKFKLYNPTLRIPGIDDIQQFKADQEVAGMRSGAVGWAAGELTELALSAFGYKAGDPDREKRIFELKNEVQTVTGGITHGLLSFKGLSTAGKEAKDIGSIAKYLEGSRLGSAIESGVQGEGFMANLIRNGGTKALEGSRVLGSIDALGSKMPYIAALMSGYSSYTRSNQERQLAEQKGYTGDTLTGLGGVQFSDKYLPVVGGAASALLTGGGFLLGSLLDPFTFGMGGFIGAAIGNGLSDLLNKGLGFYYKSEGEFAQINNETDSYKQGFLMAQQMKENADILDSNDIYQTQSIKFGNSGFGMINPLDLGRRAIGSAFNSLVNPQQLDSNTLRQRAEFLTKGLQTMYNIKSFRNSVPTQLSAIGLDEQTIDGFTITRVDEKAYQARADALRNKIMGDGSMKKISKENMLRYIDEQAKINDPQNRADAELPAKEEQLRKYFRVFGKHALDKEGALRQVVALKGPMALARLQKAADDGLFTRDMVDPILGGGGVSIDTSKKNPVIYNTSDYPLRRPSNDVEYVGVPGRAIGGPTKAGQMYMVGEKGPELFMPSQDGNIIPNHKVNMVASKLKFGGYKADGDPTPTQYYQGNKNQPLLNSGSQTPVTYSNAPGLQGKSPGVVQHVKSNSGENFDVNVTVNVTQKGSISKQGVLS